MTNKQGKIKTLFSYIQRYGFNQSLENIALGIGITKKTLFNRYKSREGLEKEVFNFWKQSVIERYRNRSLFTNNAVEKLIFFIYELKKCKELEAHFFDREIKITDFELIDDERSFQFVIWKILNEGKLEEVISSQISSCSWGHLLHFNIFNLILHDEKNVNIDFIISLISPLLTKEGNEILTSLNLERLMQD